MNKTWPVLSDQGDNIYDIEIVDTQAFIEVNSLINDVTVNRKQSSQFADLLLFIVLPAEI